MMNETGGDRFIGIGGTIRKKRSQTCRRPKPESQPFPESDNQSPLSSTPSDDASKISSDENIDADATPNPRRKTFNLNQCASRSSSTTRPELSSSDGLGDATEEGRRGLNHKPYMDSGVTGNGGGNETKLKKVKLKVGGVTRTIQTKSSSRGASGSVSSSKSAQSSDAPRPRPKLILQDNSDEDNSPPPHKKIGLQGVPWKDFSRSGFSLGKEESTMGKTLDRNASVKQGEKSDQVRKSKRVPKKRVLDGDFDEDDDEIRYLEKLKTSRVSAMYRDSDEESSKKHRSLSKVCKGGKYKNLKNFGLSRSGRDTKKSISESVSADTDYEEEELVSDQEADGRKKKKLRKDSPDSPTESKRETTLTSRQRALLSGRDSASASSASQIEFPNGLPPAPSRKQKEKLTEVEQQIKKAEAAERRRKQNEKAARESEVEAIRKILGQDSSRKKREDKLKKRQEELAQEKAANAQTLAPNTIRCVMGPHGTVVTFSEDMGLPRIFDPKPCSYPPPRDKCAGPSCSNPYKYRDSKSNLPLCSLQCYKAIHGRMQAGTAC